MRDGLGVVLCSFVCGRVYVRMRAKVKMTNVAENAKSSNHIADAIQSVITDKTERTFWIVELKITPVDSFFKTKKTKRDSFN